MRRWQLGLAVILWVAGCAGEANNPAPTPTGGASAEATSVVVTAKAPESDALPNGTLILLQVGNPIAQQPGGKALALPPERFGPRAAPNGRYGVRFNAVPNGIDLQLVDFGVVPNATRDVPDGRNFAAPGITWRADSSGFAFYDFPPQGSNRPVGLYFFDVGTGQSRRLNISLPAGSVVSSVAFAPDGNRLLYAISSLNAEAISGPDSETGIYNLADNTTTPLSRGASFGFNQWLRDGEGFLSVFSPLPPPGAAPSPSGVHIFSLRAGSAQRITPQTTADLLADLSPDGRRIVVTAIDEASGAPNIFIMNLDGSSRRPLTQFTNPDQLVTGLVWGLDGIYYSLSDGSGQDTTYRMDLDGTNPTRIASGTLQAVIGAG